MKFSCFEIVPARTVSLSGFAKSIKQHDKTGRVTMEALQSLYQLFNGYFTYTQPPTLPGVQRNLKAWTCHMLHV